LSTFSANNPGLLTPAPPDLQDDEKVVLGIRLSTWIRTVVLVALALAVLGWLIVLWMYLRHRIVLSSDSMNNYSHVWWIARDLWHHGRIPWKMPVLGHGQAYAYPYGFVNWTSAALLWPLFGDWAVTLWSAVGAVGCVVATFFAFPELRRSWWAAAVLVNRASATSRIDATRGAKRVTMLEANLATGETKPITKDSSATFVELVHGGFDPQERDGSWGDSPLHRHRL
jgi:hypothetical protein